MGQRMTIRERSIRVMARVSWAVLLASTVSACVTHVADVSQPAGGFPQGFSSKGAEDLPERWWYALADTTLNSLIDEGMSGSPDLAVWWARLGQARALARKAGADLWPQLDVNGRAVRSGEWLEDGSESYGTALSMGATISYEVDLWGGIRSAKEAAALNAAASQEDVRAAAMTVSSQIASTWYELAEAKGQVRVLEEQALANDQVLELVTLSFRRGKVGAADVLRQRQLLESNRGDLALVRARLQILRHQLAVLLGRSPQNTVDDTAASLVELPPLPNTGVPSDLLQGRPDLRSAYLLVASAHASTAAAVAERYPRISLSGSISTDGTEPSQLFTSWLGNLAANIITPIIDGGRRRAEAERSRAAALEAFSRYRQVVLGSLQEVEDALVSETRQWEHLRSLESQLELAEAVLERTRDAYLGGQADYLRVLDALISQQSLQRRRLTAHRLLIQYRIDLSRALGGSWLPERSAGGGGDTLVNQRNDP